ncbi:MAG: Ig-like domain-containing protein [Candidatus Amulumruptor caecigallinarius]|nr:Ig-like domain-containing protein [Candidatus Amulumruptor caecigallinarius]MCM1397663.1 Ig-like domain-containing protein [Candidatus Amulumruptor caecigallinarius]MCM1454657.1 Ig-like domain-containing protein [bacterium]
MIDPSTNFNGLCISERAFDGCTALTEVLASARRIGDYAFRGCTSLTSIDLSALTEIGKDAFTGCTALKDVYCGRLTPPTIEDDAFGPEIYAAAALSVPVESMDAYRSAPGWRNFLEITYLKVYPKSVTLDAENLDMYVGDTRRLNATLTAGSTITQTTLTWTSSNPEAVSVDPEGAVTAIGKGTATITVTTENGLAASCEVTATKQVESVTASSQYYHSTDLTLYLDYPDATRLVAKVLPTDTDYPDVVWSSSDPTVATVTQKGDVRGVGLGNAVISATAHNGVHGDVTVTVLQPVRETVLMPSEADIDLDESLQLEVSYFPEDASRREVTWKAYDLTGIYLSDVVSVDENGLVTPRKLGVAVVEATPVYGWGRSKATIHVVRKEKTITLDKTEHKGLVGETVALTAVVTPDDATNTELNWASSNEAVASVDSNGVVTLTGGGEATVTVTTAHGLTASSSFSVFSPSSIWEIALDNSRMEIERGADVALTGRYNRSDKALTDFPMPLTWTSSDTDVVSVGSYGVMHGHTAGTATVTVAWFDTKASCEVEVFVPVESIFFTESEVTVVTEDGYVPTAKIPKPVTLPEDAKYGSYTDMDWYSSDEDVLGTYERDDNGRRQMSGKAGPGKTTLTVKTHNGLTASIDVTVHVPIEYLFITGDADTYLNPGETVQLTTYVSPARHSETLIWTSDNEEAVTVDADGLATAHSPGGAILTVAASGGKEATARVYVLNERRIDFRESVYTAALGTWYDETIELNASLAQPSRPEDAVGEASWSVDDPSILSLGNFVDFGNSFFCKATPLRGGETTVRVSKPSGLTAECRVTVTEYPASISISEDKLTLMPGETHQLYVTFTPESTTERDLDWYSNHHDIVTVSADGLLTAVSEGSAIVSATHSTPYRYLREECEVKVTKSANTTRVAADGDAMVTVIDGDIIVSGTLAEDITVRTVDGRIVYRGSDRRISGLMAGVYLVTVNHTTVKIRNYLI